MPELPLDDILEALARRFHDTYERLAPDHGWETQQQSRVPWDSVPAHNRDLMLATVGELLRDGVIEVGPAVIASLTERTAPRG